MVTSEGIPSSIDIELLELNDNPYFISTKALVPNYEESLINGFLLMGISIKAA